MDIFRKLTPGRYKTSQWAGGTTTELFIWPVGASYEKRDFSWRLSTAKVELSESDFTKLPGFKRVLIPLSGGLTLKHGGEPVFMLGRYHAHRFDGAWDTKSRGCVIDFNLMMKKGSAEGDAEAAVLKDKEGISLICGDLGPSCRDVQRAVYCFEGEVRLSGDRQCLTLAERELALIHGLWGEIKIEPQNGKPAVIVSVTIGACM